MCASTTEGLPGMETTFEELFRVEYPRLVPMLHALLGDRSRAEDVAQESLLAAQRSWSKVGGYDQPGAWVRRVALHRAANVRRRRGREAAALRRVGTSPQLGGERTLPDEALWTLVRALPDRQREAVALHYVADIPIAEIAAVLACSEGTVKTHLSRARETLARQLAGRAERNA